MSDWEEAALVVIDGAYADDDGVLEIPTATALDSDDDDDDDADAFTLHADAVVTAHPTPDHHETRNISPFLYDLTRQGTDWSAVIERALAYPEEARYISLPSRRTALHEACRADAPPPAVVALLEADRSAAGKVDARGNAPLHLVFSGRRNSVVGEDRPAVVECLLDAHPDSARIQNDSGSNPLMVACDDQTVDPDIVQTLLLASPSCASASDQTGRTALARYGDACGTSLAVARLLLDAYPEAAAEVDAEGRTPLHRPAFDGNVNLVESILLRDEAVASVQDDHGRTALHRACQCFRGPKLGDNGRLEVVRLLLDADPDASSLTDRPGGRVPLHYICRNRLPDADIVRSILEVDTACASVVDSAGRTPLHDACANIGTQDIVALLLDVDPSLACGTTKKADTALHLATEKNNSVETVVALADLNPGAIVARNDYGFTPLHCVCRSHEPSIYIIRVLLDRRPESATVTSNGGELPLHMACLKPDISIVIVKALLDASGDSDMTNKARNTPLHDACFHHSSHDIIEVLATSHPNWVSMPNSSGYTPLHLTCKTGTADVRIVQTLLDAGGPDAASVVDGDGHSLVHSSCRADGSVGVVSALMQAHPAATDLATTFGDTALHLACMRNVPRDVLTAVARGGDVSCIVRPNRVGVTPLHIMMRKFQSAFRAMSILKSPQTTAPLEMHLAMEKLHDLFCKVTSLIECLCHDNVEARSPLLHAALSVRRLFGMSLVVCDFVEHVLEVHPEQVRVADDDGNLPLHIEAGVRADDEYVIEIKDGMNNYPKERTDKVLKLLIELHAHATQATNKAGEFPLDIAMQSVRKWDNGIKALLVAYPPALLWQENIDRSLMPYILTRVANGCDCSTMYRLVKSKPDLAQR